MDNKKNTGRQAPWKIRGQLRDYDRSGRVGDGPTGREKACSRAFPLAETSLQPFSCRRKMLALS